MNDQTLTGRQVLALLSQDEVPEIEIANTVGGWAVVDVGNLGVSYFRKSTATFRIKPTPQRRISITLANGEVVSWPEPVRKALKDDVEYWYVDTEGDYMLSTWGKQVSVDTLRLAFGNVHLTREAAQEHADSLRKINMQEAV